MLMCTSDMENENKPNLYQCPVCKLNYLTEELAKQCEDWCTKTNSCNLDIIKHAVKEE